MDTKEKILQAALKLYNTEGITVITSRHIAASMNISHGNLHYHFKHTDEIIQSLYDRLAAEFDGIILQMDEDRALNMEAFDRFSTRSLEIMYKYRFIFLHFVEIGRRIPAVREDYFRLTKRRAREFKTIFKQLVKNGVFRRDLPDKIWAALVTQIFIMGDFWLSNNELTGRLEEKEAVAHYRKIFRMMFLPYLAKV